MISTSKSFLFVHIPKTGGNSIQQALKPYADDTFTSHQDHQDGVERFELSHPKYRLKKHSLLSEYHQQLSKSKFEELFKFTVIRNPWDMMISLYFSPHRKASGWNRSAFIQLVNNTPSIEDRLSIPRFSLLRKGNLREVFQHYSLDGHLDFVLRFEHLQDDFEELCKQLGIPTSALPHYNRSGKTDFRSYYDRELTDLITAKFKKIIEYGGYQFP